MAPMSSLVQAISEKSFEEWQTLIGQYKNLKEAGKPLPEGPDLIMGLANYWGSRFNIGHEVGKHIQSTRHGTQLYIRLCRYNPGSCPSNHVSESSERIFYRH